MFQWGSDGRVQLVRKARQEVQLFVEVAVDLGLLLTGQRLPVNQPLEIRGPLGVGDLKRQGAKLLSDVSVAEFGPDRPVHLKLCGVAEKQERNTKGLLPAVLNEPASLIDLEQDPGEAFHFRTSTNSAITWIWPSTVPVNSIGAYSGLFGFRVILAWRQESPSSVLSLSYRLTV